MRHRVYGKHLGRNKDERSRLFKTLLGALFTYGTIETSQEKGKAIKGLVDKVINLAKNRNTRRLLQSYIYNRDIRNRLIKEILPKLENRSSGYTSLIRLGSRLGDQTMMVKMSLIGAEELESVKEESRVKSSASVKTTADRQESRKKTEEPIKKEIKAKEKTKKVPRKSTRTVKVNTSRRGAKKS